MHKLRGTGGQPSDLSIEVSVGARILRRDPSFSFKLGLSALTFLSDFSRFGWVLKRSNFAQSLDSHVTMTEFVPSNYL